MVPPLAFFCIRVLGGFPDQLRLHHRRVPATPALLGALRHAPDPCLWAALAQLVHPLPPALHDRHLPLSHPAVPILQKVHHSQDFSLVTLVALPNCARLRDNDVANLRALHRLLALDLRGCSISPYAITALARGLAADGSSGPWGIRLLGLHGCPNIDDDVIAVLPKFPLLSAVDLRFTRCTPFAVNTLLSPLGFRPSDNSTLFYPAPLSLALCSLEKAALTALHPISLYSCPPPSVFRLHIDKLDQAAPVASSSTSHDTAAFTPPLRKPMESEPSLPCSPSVSSTKLSVASQDHVSNASSFYEKVPIRSGKNVLPMSAQAVQSSASGKLDPLAIARSPPPWSVLETHRVSICHQSSGGTEDSQRTRPVARWIGDPLKVDRARLHKRGSDAVADMMHQFTCKRPKIESEFALAKTQAKVSVKPRNPFVRGIRSVFAESSTVASERSQSPIHEPAKEVKSALQLRACRSLPSQTMGRQGTNVERTSNKPLRPITSLKPPILPKEFCATKPRPDLRQTTLPFSREVERWA